MKYLKYSFLIINLMIIALIYSCREGIDPITQVAPGTDNTAPEVNITFPKEGTVLKVLEEVATVNIKFEATDDIELDKITVSIDGSNIMEFTDFLDYRRYLADFDYDQVTDGVHTLTVTATDLSAKSTSASVTFEKEPAYVPIYEGEVLYMPFDGDFIDLVSISQPTIVGNPGFAGEAIGGLDAYSGAEGAYLTMSTADLLSDEISAAFWLKVNATPDRAGILVMGPEDSSNPDAQNVRTNGFRFFRENAGGEQRFKLNVGNGDGENWFDGGDAADVVPDRGEWDHFAFTISADHVTVYINGQVVSEGDFPGIDWTGCDLLSIMSGAPRFTGWGHLSDQSFMDELRIFNRALTQAEIQQVLFDDSGRSGGYTPKYEGETFYMSFDGAFTEMVSGAEPTVIGTPEFSEVAKVGSNAYAGVTDAYLSFPTNDITADEFSAVFWMNINATPDRAGILVIGPQDADNPDAQNNRSSGFRFFRENAGGNQIFKLNAGNGEADSWFDGGEAAQVEPDRGEWDHFAFTISGTQCVIYINGEIASEGEFSGIDWTGCDQLSIMSGVPRFTGWEHFSDLSLMDELRLFNKALSQAEIQQIIADEM